MNGALLLPAATAAVSVGLGCGTCCSPIISTFLSTYVASHAGGVKWAVGSFLSFFFGKMISVTALCTVSAMISSQFISDSGYIGSLNLRLCSQIAMSVVGVLMLVRWFRRSAKRERCGGCQDCSAETNRSGFAAMSLAGLSYGATPCTPLILMIGYCFSLPVAAAGITGILFSAASMVSPVLLLVVITGALSKRMRADMRHAVKWFQLASYLVLVILPFFLTE